MVEGGGGGCSSRCGEKRESVEWHRKLSRAAKHAVRVSDVACWALDHPNPMQRLRLGKCNECKPADWSTQPRTESSARAGSSSHLENVTSALQACPLCHAAKTASTIEYFFYSRSLTLEVHPVGSMIPAQSIPYYHAPLHHFTCFSYLRNMLVSRRGHHSASPSLLEFRHVKCYSVDAAAASTGNTVQRATSAPAKSILWMWFSAKTCLMWFSAEACLMSLLQHRREYKTASVGLEALHVSHQLNYPSHSFQSCPPS